MGSTSTDLPVPSSSTNLGWKGWATDPFTWILVVAVSSCYNFDFPGWSSLPGSGCSSLPGSGWDGLLLASTLTPWSSPSASPYWSLHISLVSFLADLLDRSSQLLLSISKLDRPTQELLLAAVSWLLRELDGSSQQLLQLPTLVLMCPTTIVWLHRWLALHMVEIVAAAQDAPHTLVMSIHSATLQTLVHLVGHWTHLHTSYLSFFYTGKIFGE